jgi:hypothetical protein
MSSERDGISPMGMLRGVFDERNPPMTGRFSGAPRPPDCSRHGEALHLLAVLPYPLLNVEKDQRSVKNPAYGPRRPRN